MLKPILLALCCLSATATARAADVAMGSVTLKLDPPAGECALDPRQPSDKRMIDFLTGSLANGKIDLLGVSADCAQLRDWRVGRIKFLGRFTQYQTPTPDRARPFGIAEVKASCEVLRQQGERMSNDATASANESIQQFNKQINFEGQKFIGVVADDPNGCYVALFQKYKAETGDPVSQISLFFHGSLKDRPINIYFFAAYDDDTLVKRLLAQEQAHVAKVKAANGL